MKKEYIENGTRFGKWTILEDLGYLNGSRKFRCKCECGSEKIVCYSHLKSGKSKSCGKCNEKYIQIGSIFGKWTVIDIEEHASHGTHRKALCLCECGTVRWLPFFKLLEGKTKSCGCWRNHAKDYPRLYSIYKHMIGRCYSPTDAKYKDYGERGVKVCDEWKKSHGFDNFAEWAFKMGYKEQCSYGECTIDRIDVNGDYEPSNCRWTNLKTQANNKRNNIRLEYDGENHTIAEWAELLNMSSKKLYNRFYRGYPTEDILFCGNFDSHGRRIT